MEQEVNPQITLIKTDKNIIKIKLTDQEKSILSGVIKNPSFVNIAPYLSQALHDDAIDEDSVTKIDDFMIDWMTDYPNQQEPQAFTFIRIAILSKANSGFVNPNRVTNPFGGQPPLFNEQPVVDYDNLPSYLPKIQDMIEREVQSRNERII